MSAIFFQDEIVHYEVLGRGRPLMFLHGWVGSWRYWVPTMQATSTGYRAYALDLWGFGDTAKAATRYRIEQQVSLIEGFMDQLGVFRTAVIGHGLGAVVAHQFARKRPDLVDRVLIVCCPLRGEMISERAYSDNLSGAIDWLSPAGLLPDEAKSDILKADSQAIIETLGQLKQQTAPENWDDLKMACVLVYGQNDPVVTPPTDDDLKHFPEHVQAITFDTAGHFPMLDDTNRFNRLLLDFLSLKSGESPSQLQLKDYWKRRVR